MEQILPSYLQEVIEKLSMILSPKVQWVLGGSVCQYIRGIISNLPQDIDIDTDKLGAQIIGELLRPFEIVPIQFRNSDQFSSYFGKFRIDDVRVEVMGNLTIRHDKLNYNYAFHQIISKADRFKVGRTSIYLMPIEDQLIGYLLLQRYNRVRAILNHKSLHNMDMNYINERLKLNDISPGEIVTLINKLKD